MKKIYKKTVVIAEELLKQLIIKYESEADNAEADVLKMLKGKGLFSTNEKFKKRKAEMEIYMEIYNDLLELQETLKDENS